VHGSHQFWLLRPSLSTWINEQGCLAIDRSFLNGAGLRPAPMTTGAAIMSKLTLAGLMVSTLATGCADLQTILSDPYGAAYATEFVTAALAPSYDSSNLNNLDTAYLNAQTSSYTAKSTLPHGYSTAAPTASQQNTSNSCVEKIFMAKISTGEALGEPMVFPCPTPRTNYHGYIAPARTTN
jgi:hypothetical protein